MRPTLHQRALAAAAQRAAADGVRVRRTVEARDGVRAVVDGQVLMDFCSNDYLGLGQHIEVIAALQEAAAIHGVGATGSHVVSGHHALHRELEDELAAWSGYPRALLFGSGYLANLAVIQGFLGEGDACVQDKLNHACLIDGARLAGADLRRYPHADADAALRQLQARPAGAAMLATDGVFSMDGDLAPLRQLALVALSQHATLYVDDAHGAGVLGPFGRGSAAHLGLGPREVPLQLVTFGKAFGGYGAAVLGSAALIEHLAQAARPALFTTALPPAQAAATLAALRLVQREGWRRAKLHGLIARFRRGARQLGLPLLESDTPIQPLLLGGNARALALADALREQGLWLTAIRPPTVPEGRARLRITLSAAHAEVDVDRLLDALADGLRLVDAALPAEAAPVAPAAAAPGEVAVADAPPADAPPVAAATA